MDCGPASLKCLLEGFGISVSYGRLRKACQPDVDGTSIVAVEEAAIQLGLDAEQIVLPADHVLARRISGFARHRGCASSQWRDAFRRRLAAARSGGSAHGPLHQPALDFREEVFRRNIGSHAACCCRQLACRAGSEPLLGPADRAGRSRPSMAGNRRAKRRSDIFGLLR